MGAPAALSSLLGLAGLAEMTERERTLAAVLGRTRARLLALLETPSTTNQLARALHAAPGGISAHLSRLVTAGLASKVLSGHHT